MGKAIGIDLGTTNSVVAFKDTAVKVIQTGANNEDLCRSCVALDKSGQFLVGNSVYKNWKRYSPNIVVSVKRLMGTAFSDSQVQKMRADSKAYPFGIKKPLGGTSEAVSIVLRGKEYSPEFISGEILKSLKRDAATKLGDVTHAVITVPAYFTSNPQPIGFSGILLAKRQNSFYCTYFLHNRNVADTKSPYPIKRLEVIRWFNQQSMVFNQSLS